MKFNWGTGIAVLYVGFIFMIGFLVYKSCQTDIGLVSKNYYDLDLNFEEFQKSNLRGDKISENIKIVLDDVSGTIHFSFPEEMNLIKGKVTLFRPSNDRLDESFEINLNTDNEMEISIRDKKAGHWRLQIDWESKSEKFYTERALYI